MRIALIPGVPGQELEAERCFAPLLRWVRSWWVPTGGRELAQEPRVLAADPTSKQDDLVALVISGVYRQHTIPVAWHIVGAQAKGSWIDHFCRLLRLLASAVPATVPVHVLCEQGLGSRDLWAQIVALGWHPCLRYPPHVTFQPEGQTQRVPVRTLIAGPGDLWLGTGRAFRDAPLAGTLIVLQAYGQAQPWGAADRHAGVADGAYPVCLPQLDRTGLPGPEDCKLEVAQDPPPGPGPRGSPLAGAGDGHLAGRGLRHAPGGSRGAASGTRAPAPAGPRRHLNLTAPSARDPHRSLHTPAASFLRTPRPATPALPPPGGLSALKTPVTVAPAAPGPAPHGGGSADPDTPADSRPENTLVKGTEGPMRDSLGFLNSDT